MVFPDPTLYVYIFTVHTDKLTHVPLGVLSFNLCYPKEETQACDGIITATILDHPSFSLV